MISIFFRMRLSGKREVCVRFGIADPELPLILNRTRKDSQTSLRLSKMMAGRPSRIMPPPSKLRLPRSPRFSEGGDSVCRRHPILILIVTSISW